MHSKLVIAVGGAFGLGALISWAVTADRFERKMKSNQLLLGEMLRRQGEELTQLHAEKIDRLMTEQEVPWTSPTDEAVKEQAKKVQNGSENVDLETAAPLDDGVEVIAAVIPPEEISENDSEKSPGGDPDENEEFDSGVYEGRRANLQALINRYTANPDDVDTFAMQAGKAVEYDGQPPFEISRELYANDEDEGDNYAKVTLFFYERVRILVDDDEDLIEDVPTYVGWQNLRFGNESRGMSGDYDTVFIRNRRLLTDFEVVREEGDPPIHIQYGMDRAEFETNKAAGNIKFRDEDSD